MGLVPVVAFVCSKNVARSQPCEQTVILDAFRLRLRRRDKLDFRKQLVVGKVEASGAVVAVDEMDVLRLVGALVLRGGGAA